MKALFYVAAILLFFSNYAVAAQKKSLSTVNTDAFTADTQAFFESSGDNHVALVWWIPNEFWEAILSRDATTSEADKRSLLDALSGVSLLAVVQADISDFGAFTFYTKEEVESAMKIDFSDEKGNITNVKPLQKIDADLEVVIGVFKPILGAAMGNMGNNMHFYVLSDTTASSDRLIDPYKKGALDFQLKKKNKSTMETAIELPLNALFVPRKCPNGKDAHISWDYCPWSGKALKE